MNQKKYDTCCPHPSVSKYYSCCCYFDFLIENMPEKDHFCPSKIKKILRESELMNDVTIWNDKRTSFAVVCQRRLQVFFSRVRYVRSWYFNTERKTFYSVIKNDDYVKKFDITGAKLYFRKNAWKFLSLILASSN